MRPGQGRLTVGRRVPGHGPGQATGAFAWGGSAASEAEAPKITQAAAATPHILTKPRHTHPLPSARFQPNCNVRTVQRACRLAHVKAPPPSLPGGGSPGQQLQFLQVQGLQRQPPDLQVQAGFALSVFVMVVLPILP